jgi:DNA-binding response OmpR family regulator
VAHSMSRAQRLAAFSESTSQMFDTLEDGYARHPNASLGETGVDEPALLVWQDAGLIKDQWILDRTPMMIGRAPDCDVRLDLRWVSRTHARIQLEERRYVLEDAGSKNGVFVNGQRVVHPQVLEDGDRIQVAPGVELIFVDSEATAPLPGRVARGLSLDQAERRVVMGGRELVPPLSTAQYDFLALLAEEPGRVYSRREVIAAVWPDAEPEGVSDDAIDALVRRLRHRLAEVDPGHEYVVTVRGYGFRLDLDQG